MAVSGIAAGGVGVTSVANADLPASPLAVVNASSVTDLKVVDPVTDSKPEIRWWLAAGSHTDETIKETVKELADSGFAGIEYVMLNDTAVDADIWSYGTAEWVHDVKVIIGEATKYGMSVSFTSGTNWSTANIPGLDPNDDSAGHAAAYAYTCRAAGDTTDFATPEPAVSGVVTTHDYISAVAYRLSGTTTCPASSAFNTTTPVQVVASSMVDLTTDGSDGTIEWDAPSDGTYIVFTFWNTPTAQRSQPSPTALPAYAVNYFDKSGFDGLKAYWEQYLFADQEIVDLIKANGKVQMFMDSLEISAGTTSIFWTKGMEDSFQAIKGYDVRPYLPIAMGSYGAGFGVARPINGTVDFTTTADKTLRDKIVMDLYDVHTQLYMSELMVPLKEWLNNNYNIKLRAQISYGKNLEISLPSTVVDYPETETRNQREQTDIYRVWAGAAHLENKMLSSETAADDSMNYGYSLQELLQKVYSEYAGGVNRVIWHGYASQWGPANKTNPALPSTSVVWPGYEAGMGAINGRWGTRNPSYQDYGEFNDHLGRLQTILRAGEAQVDLAILYSDYAYQLPKRSFVADETLTDLKQQKHVGWQWADLTLQDAGYTYEYFAPQFLDQGYAVYDTAKGVLKGKDLSTGPSYQALLIYQDKIPLESAQAVLDMAKKGLKVILVKGSMARTEWNDGKDSDLADIRTELLTLPNVKEVKTQMAAKAALESLNVKPRVGYSTADEELLSVTRQDGDNTYVYLYNFYNVMNGWDPDYLLKGAPGTAKTDTLPYFDRASTWDPRVDKNEVVAQGILKPYLLDTWTGVITEITTYRYENGNTIVPFELADGDVKVLILKKASDTAHITGTNAEQASLNGAKATLRATKSGSYYATTSAGKTLSTTATVPAATTLKGWSLTVESWTKGALSAARTETTAVGNVATEYKYETDKTPLTATLDTLKPWSEIPAIGKAVSGIGTYTTTFTWDKAKADGAYLDLGSLSESVTVYVNGVKTSPANLITPVVELPNSLLKTGSNTLKIVVTSTLTNAVLTEGYNGAATVEGAYRDAQSQNFLFDHVLTYFDNGLLSATLRPYVDVTASEPTPTVVKEPVPVEKKVYASKVKIGQSSAVVVKGKTFKPTFGVYYTSGNPSFTVGVTWKSSNPKVAKVRADGLVTGLKAGTVTITATAKVKSKTGALVKASYKVKVVSKKPKSKVTKVSASFPTSLKVGQVAWVTGKYANSGASGVKVTYDSLVYRVVTIDPAGKLTALNKGTDTVVIKAGGKTKKYKVTVK
jgi:hypothetical protein